jgi:hypothetical protein
MVKLQKRFAYKYKDKEYFKHIITIPDEIVEQLGWKEGIEIEPKVENNELVFTRQKQKEN